MTIQNIKTYMKQKRLYRVIAFNSEQIELKNNIRDIFTDEYLSIANNDILEASGLIIQQNKIYIPINSQLLFITAPQFEPNEIECNYHGLTTVINVDNDIFRLY